MTVRFRNTEQAAKTDRLSKWELIEAIAVDADENGLPICGVDTAIAAKQALDKAKHHHADTTVTNLCMVAKFDYESTAAQRRVWRRYGWTAIRLVAGAGWSQEHAAEFLGDDKVTWLDIEAKVRGSSRSTTELPLGEAWEKWLNKMGTVLTEGAHLATRTAEETSVELSGHAAMAHMFYEHLSERAIDAELRQLFENEPS
jgi:hypothetical protein